MYSECRHVLPSGRKCTHELLQNSTFCYKHRYLHELMFAPPARPGTPFRMPLLEDADGCMMGLQQVCWAMGDKRITQKEAGTYLYAITIAKSLIPRRPAVSRKPVRALCYDNDGFEMAEPVQACEPPRDCLSCQKTATCRDFEYYEDEVEELQQALAEEEQKNLQQAQGSGQAGNPADPSQTGQQSTAEKPTFGPLDPRDPSYDDMPNIRALLHVLERKNNEAEQLQAEQQARIQARKEAFAERKEPQTDRTPADHPCTTQAAPDRPA